MFARIAILTALVDSSNVCVLEMTAFSSINDIDEMKFHMERY